MIPDERYALKPCPFCGIVPKKIVENRSWFQIVCITENCLLNGEDICCFPVSSKQQAIEAWNTRGAIK